jgi:hypothetical protein
MDETAERIRPDYRLTAFWTILFFAGMFGFPIAGHINDWPQGVIFAGMGFSMFLLFPMVRALTKAAGEVNADTPAMNAYNRRILFWSFAYVALLFGSIWLYQSVKPGGVLLFLIALLPAIPVLWTIQAITRYLGEEEDEYIRFRHIQAGIFATGITLAIASVCGFLQIFGLLPYISRFIWRCQFGRWALAWGS